MTPRHEVTLTTAVEVAAGPVVDMVDMVDMVDAGDAYTAGYLVAGVDR